jgi:hypothetical protein
MPEAAIQMLVSIGVSRNGTPVGELRPIKRRRFVPRAAIAMLQGKPPGSMPRNSVQISMQ